MFSAFGLFVCLPLAMSASDHTPLYRNTLTSASTDLESSRLTWLEIRKLFQQQFDHIIGKELLKSMGVVKHLNMSSSCRSSMSKEVIALRNFQGWAIKMVDATGKLPSGILDGTMLDFGSYDGCLRIRVNHSSGDEAFRGRYCMVGFQSPLLQPMTQKTPKGEDYIAAYGNPPDWVADVFSQSGSYLKHTSFWFGACVPSTCSKDDVQEFASFIANPLEFNVTIADCQVDGDKHWSISATVSVYILFLIAGLCILGTLLDVIQRSSIKDYLFKNSKCVPFEVLKCFSLYTNAEILLNSTKESSALSCFHGMRFYSATWIVLGHTYFFTDNWKYLKYRHLVHSSDIFQNHWPAAVLENFTIPVSTFFYMSGFLIVYSTWKKLENSNGKLNIFSFFLHKYWRMTPAQGLLIVSFLAMPLISSGPLWNSNLEAPIKTCENYWWKNILYINNWWNTEDYCLIHTWYLGELMQFHIIGIFLLLIIFRLPVIGILLGVVLSVASCIAVMLITVWNNFPMPAPASNKDIDTFLDYTDAIYTKPFCHIASYLIGMASSFIIFKYKDSHLSMLFRVLGWIMATGLALFAVYGIYMPTPSLAYRAFYLAFHRIAWSLSLLWITYSCVSGSGGIVNRILCWKALVPLGHLSYLVYLFHPLILLYKTSSLHERVYFGHNEFVMEFLSNTVMGFLLAFIGYIAIEIPFSLLEKIIFKSELSKPKDINSKEILQCQGKNIP